MGCFLGTDVEASLGNLFVWRQVPDLGDNPEEVGPSAQSERMSTLKGVWKSFGGRVVVSVLTLGPRPNVVGALWVGGDSERR